MTKVRIYHGTEGPSYDPYGYTEIEVERLGHTVCLHGGLAEWIEIDGERTDVPDMTFEEMVVKFKELTGYYPCDWEMFYHRMEARKYRNDPYYGQDYDIRDYI